MPRFMLKPCPSCARHLQVADATCPFCGYSFASTCRADLPATIGLAVAFAATLGCSPLDKGTEGGMTEDTTTDTSGESTTEAEDPTLDTTTYDDGGMYYAGPDTTWESSTGYDTRGETTTSTTTTDGDTEGDTTGDTDTDGDTTGDTDGDTTGDTDGDTTGDTDGDTDGDTTGDTD